MVCNRCREASVVVLKLDKVLYTLARSRPVFHSEADFQHALAWEIHTLMPSASIRLEAPAPDKRIRLDLLVAFDAERYAIELKYKTKAMTAKVADEQFSLRNAAAQDVGRYDFWKDVARLEQCVESTASSLGYAVFLSNDPLYWIERQRANLSEEFSIHQGRKVPCGVGMRWAERAAPGGIKGREKPMVCNSSYACSWKDYSTVGGKVFKYLLLAIQRKKQASASKRQP
jgi:hypothetical protein